MIRMIPALSITSGVSGTSGVRYKMRKINTERKPVDECF